MSAWVGNKFVGSNVSVNLENKPYSFSKMQSMHQQNTEENSNNGENDRVDDNDNDDDENDSDEKPKPK